MERNKEIGKLLSDIFLFRRVARKTVKVIHREARNRDAWRPVAGVANVNSRFSFPEYSLGRTR
jgi:hypothetical protein